MTIREGVASVTERLNNAQFRSPRQKARITQHLRERVGNALSETPERPERPHRPEVSRRRERPERTERESTQNYRQLANRVLASDLDRPDKAQLLDRIKNAAQSGNEVERPDREDERRQTERVREAANEAEGRRLLARV